MDEISTTDSSMVWEIRGNNLSGVSRVCPEDFGLIRAEISDISGGTAEQNALLVSDVLKGSKGPKRDIVVLNAAAALLAGDKVKDLKEGVEIAQETIDSGRALGKLYSLIELSNAE
jgi:anthranilate phosphoribosyltransferase